MRIAQLAPLVESVPPSHYGGTERVVAALCEELVRRGHEVTLFATGDSRSSAQIVPLVPRSLRSTGDRDATAQHLFALTQAFARADEFDVLHSHLDFLGLPFGRHTETPVLHTLHGRLDLPEIQSLFGTYPDAPLVSISNNQRRLLGHWSWLGTVYNGVDERAYTFHPSSGDYLAFLGRMAPEKGVEEAIEVARLAGIPLKIAAKVDAAERAYFDAQIRPLLTGSFVEYVGEITDAEKDAFLGNALALVFPICWPEPFGLVLIEAMATGTPVIAARFGSVPEIVVDGATGFICDSVWEMVLACTQLPRLNRAACRARVCEHFSAGHMAQQYEQLYQRLTAARSDAKPRRNGFAPLSQEPGLPV